MKRFLVLLSLSSSLCAQTLPHWSYTFPSGPYQWGSMNGSEMCQMGKEQSPVDIEEGAVAGISNTTPDSSLEALLPEWNASSFQVLFNGHTIQMNYDQGSEVTFREKNYALKQFHFHSPSEHILNGKQYPLEMHFVHQSGSNLLVIGVFVEEGDANPALAEIWKNAPVEEETIKVPGKVVSALDFLPRDLSYYNYQGSLTTPPCSEGVTWIVLKTPISAARAELQFLQKRLGGPNNRPIQPQDGRMIGVEGI